MPPDSDITRWEEIYQSGSAPWDRGSVSPPLAAWLDQNGIIPGRILVPGSGPGHEVGYLHARGMDVYGLDIAPTALSWAAKNYPEVPADRWLCADLFALKPELVGSFDAVVEHTCLSGMPPNLREAYAKAVLGALKPGGQIIGVWFIDPDLDPGESGPPFPLPVSELDAMFSGKAEVIEDFIPGNSFTGREGRERVRVLRKL